MIGNESADLLLSEDEIINEDSTSTSELIEIFSKALNITENAEENYEVENSERMEQSLKDQNSSVEEMYNLETQDSIDQNYDQETEYSDFDSLNENNEIMNINEAEKKTVVLKMI